MHFAKVMKLYSTAFQKKPSLFSKRWIIIKNIFRIFIPIGKKSGNVRFVFRTGFYHSTYFIIGNAFTIINPINS